MSDIISKQRLQRNNAALDFEALEARLEALLVAGDGNSSMSECYDMTSTIGAGQVTWWKKWLTRLGVVSFLMRHPGLYYVARRLYHRLRR